MSAFNPQDPVRQQQEMMRKQQEQMRKQQEQMRKQQEDGRRRMQMGAWAEQQRAKAAETDRFAEVEKNAAWLRQERSAGRLSEEDLKARLKELMFQDGSGVWWMVGQQSGEWYRNEGGQWVRAKPAQGAAVVAAGAAAGAARTAQGQHRMAAVIVLLLGMVVSPAAAMLGVEVLHSFIGNASSPLADTCSWGFLMVLLVGGLILTVRTSTRLWRGK